MEYIIWLAPLASNGSIENPPHEPERIWILWGAHPEEKR